MNAVAYVGAVALVVGSPVIAFLVRTGRLQKWPKAYYESGTSATVRNGAFGLVPFSGNAGLQSDPQMMNMSARMPATTTAAQRHTSATAASSTQFENSAARCG